MNRPTVWVIKEQVKRVGGDTSPMDYTPAYEHGDLRFITQFDPPLYPGSVDTEWHKQVGIFITEFDPTRDFLILTGSPLAIFMLGAIVAKLDTKHAVNVLVWRREQSRYISHRI